MTQKTTLSHLLGSVLVISWLQGTALAVEPGTTPHIREIFIGVCNSYQYTINKEPFKERPINCTDLWKKFEQASRYRKPCDVAAERFHNFTQAALHPVPENKALLWEGDLLPFVHEYSNYGKRGWAVGDTLAGYLGNELHFCGQLEEPGFNYTACPDWGSCDHAEYTFWTSVSIAYAKEVSGVSYVMLNGSSAAAYPKDSYLSKYEMPYLNPNKVRLLQALVLHDILGPRTESCGAGTLKNLEKDAKKYNIPFNCTDDPKDIMYLLCVDHADAPLCRKFACDAVSGAWKAPEPSAVVSLAVFMLILVAS